jgi:hypothetical protein
MIVLNNLRDIAVMDNINLNKRVRLQVFSGEIVGIREVRTAE